MSQKKYIFTLIIFVAAIIISAAFFAKFLFLPLRFSATRNATLKSDIIKPEKKIKLMRLKLHKKIKSRKKKIYKPDMSKPINCLNLNIFECTIKYLQYLRYLPISVTAEDKYKFSFPIPKNLGNIVDSYKWNEQNPFIIGAAAKYLNESGRIKDGEYDRPEINNKFLFELEKSAEKDEFNKQPWDWVLVRQAKTGEKAELYENGRKVFSFPVNTGVLGLTPDGTWYIFLRLPHTTMIGLFPVRISKKAYASLKLKHPKKIKCLDGHPVEMVPYADSGIKYVDYFNKGIALHYMPRKSYGFPQSAGCIELPKQYALLLYKHPGYGYGTIVTVTGFTVSKPKEKQIKKTKPRKTIKAKKTLPVSPVRIKKSQI